MAGSIQKFIDRMIYWCQTVSLGYDQSNRQDFRNGGETDCSALVIYALKEAGFDTGTASYTGNMRSNLSARGWLVLSNNGNPQPGDILLNDINHVAVYIGGEKLAQASIDENGRITGGAGGDQTGRETNISNYYNYPWTCYLRWGGSSDAGNSTGGKIKMKTLKLSTAVNLRKSASTGAGIIANLPAGTTIKFDDVVLASGYIWAVQPRTDGTKGYVAMGPITAYGSIL
ncbi:NlpC/P60 family protein [Enterococcus sp. 2201sp1_2201st1_B8_2201SCRN_220225]|uniref:NlpC/P60 family protein n=1 Tax=unclassified Enterococcus TaxID=2608891 RepID=UPI0034A54A06